MNFIERAIDLYAPHACVGCGAEGALVCVRCLCAAAKPLPRCYRCHAYSRFGRSCESCGVYGLQSVRSAVCYKGVAQDAVWRLKFGRARAAAEAMARPMALVGQSLVRDGTIIVPAPTASSRIRARGYDQAAELAKAVAGLMALPSAGLLWRLGTQRQVGANKLRRRQQMAGAFYVRDAKRVRGRHIILIDDVITTGSTLESAAQALLAAGATSVSALTFAQA